jgi:hypothetical protein
MSGPTMVQLRRLTSNTLTRAYMSPSIHVRSWNTKGITLTSAAEREFDSLTRSLFQ